MISFPFARDNHRMVGTGRVPHVGVWLGALAVLLGLLLSLAASPVAAANGTGGAVMPRAAGVTEVTAREVGASLADRLAWLVTLPGVGALLFGLGALLVVWSIVAGEAGAFTAVGLGALALFFWGHTFVGLAGWEGIALAALGIVLIAAEVLIIPGFGFAGILGGIALLGALVLSVTGGDLPPGAAVERAILSVLLAAVTFALGGGLLIRLLPATALRRGLVLQVGGPSLAADPRPSLEGTRGQALADLRPGGFALIDGERVDVVTRGEVIAAGATVEVIRDEGYRRIVRRIAPDEPNPEML